MNRRIPTMIGLAAALLALCACSSGTDAGAESTPSPEVSTATNEIPRPDDAQAAELVAALGEIVPALADEPEDSIDSARNLCTSILGDAQNLEQSTALRFDDGTGRVDEDQAAAIIELVAAEPWCK